MKYKLNEFYKLSKPVVVNHRRPAHVQAAESVRADEFILKSVVQSVTDESAET